MFQNLPLLATEEVRERRSGVTPCIVMKNDGAMYHQMSSFSPEFMRLSFRQSESATERDPAQHKRLTYPCYRAVITEHQQR